MELLHSLVMDYTGVGGTAATYIIEIALLAVIYMSYRLAKEWITKRLKRSTWVIDDDPYELEMIKLKLRERGIEVRTICNPKTEIHPLEPRPDICFVDYNLSTVQADGDRIASDLMRGGTETYVISVGDMQGKTIRPFIPKDDNLIDVMQRLINKKVAA